MTIYEVKLTGREEVAEGTMAFHFEKPPGFTFKPGQAVDLVLHDASVDGEQDGRHAFSLVSAPFENQLIVATRLRDTLFKRVLKSMPIGASAHIDGPFGSLTLHNKRTRPAVFIAGGIGITPFMSILRQAAQDQLPHQLSLIYSNRRPEDAAFLTELQTLEQRNKNFRLIATMTEMDKSARSWQGETGLIDGSLLKRTIGDILAPIYYLVGPPALVAAMRQALNLVGIDDDDIRTEEFFGY